jgi:hypothetical protein
MQIQERKHRGASARRGWSHLLVALMMTTAVGCTSTQQSRVYEPVERRLAQVDDVDVLLMKAGVELEEIPAGEAWSAAQANGVILWLRFKISDGRIPAYGPRILASFLLEEALRTKKPITRRELAERLRIHSLIAVLNPEGHLVRAFSGEILECAGPLHIEGGVPRAGPYKVDTFYLPHGKSYLEAPNLVAPAIFLPAAPQIIATTGKP